jgi:hypothetical protein
MDDREPFDLPPEREVSAQLRAQVLHQAVISDTAGRRPGPRWLGPLAVGLGAAAVVVSVVVMVTRPDAAEGPPAAGTDHTEAPQVEPHNVLAVNVKTLETFIPLREACMKVAPAERAGHVLSSQLLRGPSGPFTQFAYANTSPGTQEGQFFCTPYGVTQAEYLSHLTSLEAPVKVISGSRVGGLVPGKAGSGTQAYFDGTWLAVSQGIASIEVRIIIGADPGVWHETRRWRTSYVFASTWRTLTPEQSTADVTVEYRAITTDGKIVAVPGLSSVVVPAGEYGPLAVTVPGLVQSD